MPRLLLSLFAAILFLSTFSTAQASQALFGRKVWGEIIKRAPGYAPKAISHQIRHCSHWPHKNFKELEAIYRRASRESQAYYPYAQKGFLPRLFRKLRIKPVRRLPKLVDHSLSVLPSNRWGDYLDWRGTHPMILTPCAHLKYKSRGEGRKGDWQLDTGLSNEGSDNIVYATENGDLQDLINMHIQTMGASSFCRKHFTDEQGRYYLPIHLDSTAVYQYLANREEYGSETVKGNPSATAHMFYDLARLFLAADYERFPIVPELSLECMKAEEDEKAYTDLLDMLSAVGASSVFLNPGERWSAVSQKTAINYVRGLPPFSKHYFNSDKVGLLLPEDEAAQGLRRALEATVDPDDEAPSTIHGTFLARKYTLDGGFPLVPLRVYTDLVDFSNVAQGDGPLYDMNMGNLEEEFKSQE